MAHTHTHTHTLERKLGYNWGNIVSLLKICGDEVMTTNRYSIKERWIRTKWED